MTDKEKLIEIDNIVSDLYDVANDAGNAFASFYAGKLSAILELKEKKEEIEK